MKRKLIVALVVGVLGVSLMSVAAAEEITLVLKQKITSVTPIFMDPAAPDPMMLAGYGYTQDLLFEDTKIGTEVGEIRTLTPPFNPLAAAISATMVGTLTIPGLGSWSLNGYTVALGGATAATTGELVFTYSGSYTEGTDALAGFNALGSGTGKVNFMTGTGGDMPFTMTIVPWSPVTP